MKKFIIAFLFLSFIVTSKAQVKLATLDDLKGILEFQEGKVVVINFWATWCRPCVKELPSFDEVGQELQEEGVDMVLINLDALNRLETNVKPFLKKRDLKSTVWLLDEPDFNSWLPLVNNDWSGAIPATLVVDGVKNEKRFHEGELSKEELIRLIKSK